MTGIASKERLAVSTAGMRQLHAGRPAWSLVKELVQNAWDEAPEATVCDVQLAPCIVEGDLQHKRTIIKVEDDGPGFRDIRDAYTLMAPTPKRGDPKKRGRFNIGEKELIAVALHATVETVGTTVTFPREGGRHQQRNTRKRGTIVTLEMPWGKSKREQVLEMLAQFQPPANCRLVVNGHEVHRRQVMSTARAHLATVVQRTPQHPMQIRKRMTDIEVVEKHGEVGWLYEMGIPIQATTLGYDVDIQQKVPMPPNRDTVSSAYLRSVAAEVLNVMHAQMGGEEFAATWVRSALEDKRIEAPAVSTAIKERYGDKVAMWSTDKDANMKAAEAGYEVLHPRSMSPEERTHMKELGGLQSAKELFGRTPATEAPTVVELNDVKEQFAQWVIALGKRAGLKAVPVFIKATKTNMAACCTANSKNPVVQFNVAKLSDKWLAERGPAQLQLVIHEFGHAVANTPMEHGPKWGEATCTVGGRLYASVLSTFKAVQEAVPA